jgi:hypothetical protein
MSVNLNRTASLPPPPPPPPPALAQPAPASPTPTQAAHDGPAPAPAPAPAPSAPAAQPDPAKKADELIKDAQHQECAVSLPGIGDHFCGTETDGAKVGKEVAALAKTEPAYARAVFDKAMDKVPNAEDRKEIAHGVADGLSHDELKAMAGTTQGRTMLDRSVSELKAGSPSDADKQTATRVESARKAADLSDSQAFKKLDANTQAQVLDQIKKHETDGAAVDNVVALSKSAGFQAASPPTRKALVQALDHHAGDKTFREGLEKLAADPAFGKLTPAQQADAVRAFDNFADSQAYKGKEGSWFFNLGAKSVSDADKAKGLDNLRQLVTAKGYHDLAPAAREQLLKTFEGHATDAGFTQRLTKLANDSGFTGLNDQNKEIALLKAYGEDSKFAAGIDSVLANPAYAALAADSDRTKALAGISTLAESKDFEKLSGDEKLAALTQIGNYPDAKVAANFEKLVAKDWFKDMSLEDKQRSLKTIAYMTAYSGGDRITLDNTLNKLLDQDYSLEWTKQAPGVGAHSNPGTHKVSMNLTDVAADNKPVASSEVWQIVNAVPHEINHAIDDVHVASTYEYLGKEYQAYFTGFKAQNGREMTRLEAVNQWQGLLDPNGIYKDSANGALAEPDEAKKIFDQIKRLTGVEVDASNYQEVMNHPENWQPPYDAAAGKPDIAVPGGAKPPGNTDNH